MQKTSIFTLVFINLCLLYNIDSSAQRRNCETDSYLEQQIKSNPRRIQIMENIERHTTNYTGNSNRTNGVIRIPVVVHVIYKNTSENLSDDQIKAQIAILNQDFRRLNTNQNNRWSQADDMKIEFCLASIDPKGAATNGITRTQTSASSFSVSSDFVKYDQRGGKNAWSAGEYLNIWIADITGTALGYAQFPGGSAVTDGVVIDFKYFGNGSHTAFPYNLGRTATHEVGHWLNLKHIWGAGNCTTDDLVNDTPMASGPHFGCQVGAASCSGINMVENYMDYSDDVCMNLFTKGQKSRMLALFSSGGARASILSSKGCGTPTPPLENCVNIKLNLNYDNYPSETSWRIVNKNGVEVVRNSSYKGSPQYSEEICLSEGCYTFYMYDAYGDGICCRYGNGSYTISNDGKTLLSGGEFKAQISHEFCVSLTKPTCIDGIQNGIETGIDCGGSCAPCKVIKVDTTAVEDKMLISGYFESGWDGWSGGASDTYRYYGDYSYEGDYSIMLRDDSGAESAMTSTKVDLTPYQSVEIKFSFFANSMEANEDFWLMYHDGTRWQTLKAFVSGTDYYNNQFYEVTYIMDKNSINFSKNSQFRIQCDASSNADQVYIDAVTIKGMTTGLRLNRGEVQVTTRGRYIGDVNSELQLSVFPNPVDDILYTAFDGTMYTYSIFNIGGKTITKNINWGQKGDIDVSSYEPGIYILQVMTDEGMVTTKFMKR